MVFYENDYSITFLNMRMRLIELPKSSMSIVFKVDAGLFSKQHSWFYAKSFSKQF